MTVGAARCWVSPVPGADHLVLQLFEPPAPGPGELLVDVRAAALNFSDTLMIDDKYQVRPPRPFTPGQEIAGFVTAAGSAARHQPGDRVAGKVIWGGFATQAVMRDDMAIAVPQDLSFEESAALPVVYTTAYVALTEDTEVGRDDTVLVHAAAGGIGLAAVQVAVARGAIVIATAGSARKRAIAEGHGAAHSLDYKSPSWVKDCLALTGGRGVDIVVDPVGGEITTASLNVMATGARLLIVGFASGAVAAIPAHKLLLKRLSAIGVYWNHDTDGAMLERVTQRMIADAQAGLIRPVVDIRDGLEALPRALADLASRSTSGKVVLRLHDGEIPNG